MFRLDRLISRLSSVALIVSLVSSSACGLVFGGSRQVVQIDSSPSKAKVTTSPATQDYSTPTSMSLQRNRSYAVTLSADGYAPKTIEIQRHMRPWAVVGDVVFLLFLVPIIVDAATGGWYKLEPKETTVTLDKTNAAIDGPAQIVVTLKSSDQPSGTLVEFRSNSPAVRATVQ